MSDRAQVLKNLALNMGVAQLIFQLGAHQTQSKVNITVYYSELMLMAATLCEEIISRPAAHTVLLSFCNETKRTNYILLIV